MDLVRHLNLAGQNLLGCLCPERNYLPYWHMVVDAERCAEYEFRPRCTGHNVGRWWNAMLRLQACTGFDIPPDIEAAMLENTWRLSDNPTGILLEDPDPDNARTWYIHSYRETMLALGLLVKFRNSERARDQGLRALSRMRKASDDLTEWDFSRCSSASATLKPLGCDGDGPYTHGRAIEGLLCFYEATRAPEALEEAERLADFHVQHTVARDGGLAPGCGHHTHSYLNTLRGLLWLAGLKQQKDRLDALCATYRNAVSSMITRSGFVTHDIGAHSGGDIASAGDIAHIALLLWDHFRDPMLLDDAERIVRCRLIPAQVCEPMSIRSRRDESRDCFRDLPERFTGAIGGSVGHVRGQTCVTDFTAAALHSLLELYQRAVEIDDRSIRINFHFNCERPDLSVECMRDGSERRVDIRNDTGMDLLVRIPGWAPASSVRLFVNDKPLEATTRGSFARIPGDGRPSRVRLHFSLPVHQNQEERRDASATQGLVTFHWIGDEIRKVDPFGRYLEPFPAECRSFSGES